MVALGEKLRELRISRKLSQKELADKIGTHKNAISNYESGKRVPPADTLQNMAVFFQVSVDYLLGLEKPHNLPLDGLSDEQCLILSNLAAAFRDPSMKKTKKLTQIQLDILESILGQFSTERD